MKQYLCVNFLNSDPIPSPELPNLKVFEQVDPLQPEAFFKKLSFEPTLIFVNAPELSWLNSVRKKLSMADIILVTSLPMHEYETALDHRVSDYCDHIFHRNDFLTKRLVEGLIALQDANFDFGIEKFFGGEFQFTRVEINHSSERHAVSEKLQRFALDECGAHEYQGRNLRTICDELLTNALYDAPVAGGVVKPEDYAKDIDLANKPIQMGLGCDEEYLVIGVRDSFGSFKREKFFEYAQKIVKHHHKQDLLDHKIGGAGLGLLRILFYCHALVVNVKPGISTEVIALLHRKHLMQSFTNQPRSFSYSLVK